MDEEIQEKTTIYTKKNSPLNVRKILAWAVLAIVIIVIIILIVAIINTIKRNRANRASETVVVKEEEKKTETVLPTDEEAVKVEVKPNVQTDMVAFIEEYHNNTSAANAKYAGKEVETYGYIQNMTTSFADGRPFISIVPIIAPVYTDERIQCFVKDETVFEGLNPGDGIIVKGIVQNFDLGFVPFENCSITK